MALPSFYNTGTASVANGATTVTGTGTGWGGDVLLAGDLFMDPAQSEIPPQHIASVTDGTHIELAVGWPGTTMAAAAYEVRFVGNIERSTAQTRRVLEQLGNLSADGVAFDPPAGMTADDVQEAIEELHADLDGFEALPHGGTIGQVLSKQSSVDGDADWIDPVSTAAGVTFAPSGNVAATTVQGNTFTGSATGQRYSGFINGTCDVGGAGATYLPGSIAGTTFSGAQYV